MRQNRWFRKWYKTADFEKGTKPPILWKRTNCYESCFTDKSVFVNYQNLATILSYTFRKWDTMNSRQFPSLFATNKFSRMPTPEISFKPSLSFNLRLLYPPPIFCVPKSSEKFQSGSFLLIQAPPHYVTPQTHTIIYMRNNNRRNVLPHVRVNFSQSETDSLLSGEEGGGLNFEFLLWRGSTEKILKVLLKKLKHHCEKFRKGLFGNLRFMQLSIEKNQKIIWRKN